MTLGRATAFDLHFRLRPVLRRLAGDLLAARRGIELDREPGRGRSARSAGSVGSSSAPTGAARRTAPAPASDLPTLDRVVTTLEAL